MSAKPFLDTNILVYAHDLDAGAKHSRARDLLRSMWEPGAAPWISIQVLQEFHVNLVRKGQPVRMARKITDNYLIWPIVENDKTLFTSAQIFQERYKVSFWDALIVAAAHRAGAAEIWSEDLGHGQRFGQVRVSNPLR